MVRVDKERIIKTLKEGPDFGIHGTRVSNLAEIMRGYRCGRNVVGHYFGADERARALPDDEFYRRLKARLEMPFCVALLTWDILILLKMGK